jgi:transposase-like protein
MSRKPRKHYTPLEKVAILREHLLEGKAVSEVCERHGLQPTVLYAWQKQFFENGATAFERRNKRAEEAKDRAIIALQEKLAKKNEVIAELMEENVQSKKALGGL